MIFIYNNMTYLKYYENIEDNLEVGDYVLIKINILPYTQKQIDTENFINNTIGKIIDIITDRNDVVVLYENVPETIKSYFNINNGLDIRTFDINRIVEHGKTKEQLELKLQANKFNL